MHFPHYFLRIFCAFALVCSSAAQAASNLISQPLQVSDESIRYQHGQATVDLYGEGGSIQIRPSGMDHGSLTFMVAVFNSGGSPANIDVSNFSIIVGGKTYRPFTVEELQKKAKSRATWASVALALAGGLSAYAAASQRETYTGTLYTPRGVYQSVYSAPSTVGQIEAAAIVAGTGIGISAIQNKLDSTLNSLGDEIVQLSTVDPGNSYGGRIVFQKIPFKKLPGRAEMVIDWNGHKYQLQFQIAKPGTPAPPFKPVQVFNAPPSAAGATQPSGDAPSSGEAKPGPTEQKPHDQSAPAADIPDTVKT